MLLFGVIVGGGLGGYALYSEDDSTQVADPLTLAFCEGALARRLAVESDLSQKVTVSGGYPSVPMAQIKVDESLGYLRDERERLEGNLRQSNADIRVYCLDPMQD